jgi:recombination protein RecT
MMSTLSRRRMEAAEAAKWVKMGYGDKPLMLSKLIHHVGEDVLDKAYNEAIERNPRLAECTPESLIGALIQMLQNNLGLDHVILEPVYKKMDTGEYGYVCVFRLGYKGYLELSRRCNGGIERRAHGVEKTS